MSGIAINKTETYLMETALGCDEEAMNCYKQAIYFKSDDADVHYCLGITYNNLGRHQEAIDTFKQAIKIKPDFAEPHYGLGFAYGDLGRYQDAIESYSRLLESSRIMPMHTIILALPTTTLAAIKIP